MSNDLAQRLRLGLEELAAVREQLTPLISIPEASVGVIERAAACAMLHSFYTEIEKILKLIARQWDGQMPSSETWHRDLLNQMSVATATRPAVLSPALVEVLGEFLAFRQFVSRGVNRFDAVGEARTVGFEGRANVRSGRSRNHDIRTIH